MEDNSSAHLVCKSPISDHLKSKTHTKMKAECEEQNARKKQRPLTASLQFNSTAQTKKVIQDFVKMCLEANMPLENADHPAVRAFLLQHVKNKQSISESDQLRRAYLPDGYENEHQFLNSQDCGQGSYDHCDQD